MRALRQSTILLAMATAGLALAGNAAADYALSTDCGDVVLVDNDPEDGSSGNEIVVDASAVACPGPWCPPITCYPCVMIKPKIDT